MYAVSTPSVLVMVEPRGNRNVRCRLQVRTRLAGESAANSWILRDMRATWQEFADDSRTNNSRRSVSACATQPLPGNLEPVGMSTDTTGQQSLRKVPSLCCGVVAVPELEPGAATGDVEAATGLRVD